MGEHTAECRLICLYKGAARIYCLYKGAARVHCTHLFVQGCRFITQSRNLSSRQSRLDKLLLKAIDLFTLSTKEFINALMHVPSRLGYILRVMSLYCCLWKNEETLTYVTILCTAYSSKLNISRNFEPLACRIYRFMDIACNTPLHQPGQATHPHRYTTSALFAQCFIIDCHYQSKRTCFTLQWRTIPNLLWY